MVVVIEQVVKHDQSGFEIASELSFAFSAVVRCRHSTAIQCALDQIAIRKVPPGSARPLLSWREALPFFGERVGSKHYAVIGKQELFQLLYQLCGTRSKLPGNVRLASSHLMSSLGSAAPLPVLVSVRRGCCPPIMTAEKSKVRGCS